MEDPELTLTSSHYVTLGMRVHVHTFLPPVVWSLHLHPSMIMGLDGTRINEASPKPHRSYGNSPAQQPELALPLCVAFSMGYRKPLCVNLQTNEHSLHQIKTINGFEAGSSGRFGQVSRTLCPEQVQTFSGVFVLDVRAECNSGQSQFHTSCGYLFIDLTSIDFPSYLPRAIEVKIDHLTT